MSSETFVHLHVHSEYSLLDGLSRIPELVQRAKELGQPAIALTDHGVMYGTMQFYRACKKAGIKPIIGVETYLAARQMTDRDPVQDKNRFHMLLLAANQAGYSNLLQLTSASQLEGYYYKPRIDRAFMAQYSEGLIATTGCMSAEIPRAIAQGELKRAHQLMAEYVDIFGQERLFIELQEHSIPELRQVNKTLMTMAPRYNLRFLATNDVHYTRARDADPHQVLLCIQTSSKVSSPKLTFSDQGYYLKSYQEMAQMFGEVPGALSNSLLIAEMCDVDLDTDGYHLPQFEVPAGFDAHSYLRHLCEQGLVTRYGQERAAQDPALRARLDYELQTIHRMAFDTYFLIVWDLCEFASRSESWWQHHRDPYPYQTYEDWKRNDIWWNVRGSGAGSVVAYTLGITSLDPIENGLIFERFLNPGRVSMPDIDLDYPDDRRHEMVEYTMRKYGQEKVAQIITFGTLGARAAIRDVGRALDMELEEVDAIARLIPAIPGKPARIQDVLDKEHEFYSVELAQKAGEDDRIDHLLTTAQTLEGVSRHASSHAAGVIISDRPLHEYVPLNRPTSGDAGLGGLDRVTQWPMEVVEAIGLLKVDFLGLSTLTVMRLAARLIEERHGVTYTMDNIPYDVGQVGPDARKKPEALFEMLSQGEVSGVFQVEGKGMRRLMMEMKPRRFDHIIAAISLYRPGPMENIPEYIRRMHAAIYQNRDVVKYHTPELEAILQDTYGILVYQEQIIRIAADLAGYEPGEADMIRKAVAKKKIHLMNEHRTKFMEGAMRNGYSEDVCQAIWGDIEFFARYGFNKAHAADYAKVTCQTAFLKAHYPVEYMSALLTVERDKTDKVTRFLADTRRMGIEVLPPSVNDSGLDFQIQQLPTSSTVSERQRPGLRFDFPVLPGSAIRFGIGAIKNVGEGAVNTILNARAEGGTFSSLEDFYTRVDLRQLNKRTMECLIKAGAFDEFGDRETILAVLDRMMARSSSKWAAAGIGQKTMFDELGFSNAENGVADLFDQLPEIQRVTVRERLGWERELLGVYVSEHPLERVTANLHEVITGMCSDVVLEKAGRRLALAGMISAVRTIYTRKGERMAFLTLEDLQGSCEVTIFPRTFQRTHSQLLAEGSIVLVRGKVDAKNDRVSLLADEISDNFTYAQPLVDNAYPEFAEPPPATWFEEESADPSGDDDAEAEENWGVVEAIDREVMPSSLDTTNGISLPALNQEMPDPASPRFVKVRLSLGEDKEYNNRRLAEVVALLKGFEGDDRFRLLLSDSRGSIGLEFPNETTRYCAELTGALHDLLGTGCLEVD